MTTGLTSEMQKENFYLLALPSDGWKTKTPIAIVWSDLYNSPCIIFSAIHRLQKNYTIRPNDESTRLSYSHQMTVFQYFAPEETDSERKHQEKNIKKKKSRKAGSTLNLQLC